MYDAIIELRVRNHPGVMSQITGLFARRAFNLEGIVCFPEADAVQRRMVLMVCKNPRMNQLVKQLAKLYDVLTVTVHPNKHCAAQTGLMAIVKKRFRLRPGAGQAM